MFPDTLA